MKYENWEPLYKQIMEGLAFNPEDDINSAEILAALMKGNKFPRGELIRFIAGKKVVVVGDSDKESSIPDALAEQTVIAADGATKLLMEWGRQPDIIVTDLDGDLESQKEANRRGALVIVHAHGDNLGKIKNVKKMFKGEIMGTCQCKPLPKLTNYGGFTDGDRAVYMAEALGASKIILFNFDFDNPSKREGKDPAMKKRKLAWARKLIEHLGVNVEMY